MINILNNILPMPPNIAYYNECNESCDMIIGPCSCRSWHTKDYWEDMRKSGKLSSVGYSIITNDIYRKYF